MIRRPRRTAVVWTPDLRIETRRTGSTVRCALAGALHQDNQDAFALALHRGLRSRPERLRIDLRAVDLFTSSALDTLLRARHAAAVLGVAMALDSPSPCVRRVLEITRAAPFLPVEDGGPGPAPHRVERGRTGKDRTGPPGAGRGPLGPGRGTGLRRHWG